MVRSAERRIEKYKHNVDGAAVGRAIKALKEIMVDQQRSYFPQISLLEMKVKKIVEAAGIPVQQVAQYINVARKCYHIAKTFSQATRDAEAQNIVDLWTSRGLNGLLVAEVCGLTGCKPTGAAPILFCQIATGTYTGDGTISQPIIGVGFQPLFVWIIQHATGALVIDMFVTSDQYTVGLSSTWIFAGDIQTRPNMIISLDADGFTVDDAGADSHPNKLNQVYDYIVWG